MRIIYLCGVYAMFGVCLSSPSLAAEMSDEIPSISVIADPSLALPMTEIIAHYTKEKRMAVSVSFQSAEEQEFEVSEEASYDVLVTSRSKLIDAIKLKGLVDIYTEATVARNRLVLAAPLGSRFQAPLQDRFPTFELVGYFSSGSGLVLGSPETLPVGSVARDALRQSDALEYLEPYTVYEKDMADIFSMVCEEGYLAIIFESDLQGESCLRSVGQISEHLHAPVNYYAVVLAGDRMEEARQFVNYIKLLQSQATFQKYGLLKP